MAQEVWTTEFPKEEGFYWFYGDPFVSEYHKDQWAASLRIAKVMKIPNGFMYVADGHFFENRMQGLWLKIEKPQIPDFGWKKENDDV